MPEVRFAMLGVVQAWRDQEEIALGSPQQRAALCLLLLRQPAAVTLDEMIDSLWGEAPPPGARGTARTYIHRLRRVLASGQDQDAAIESAGGGYVLRAEAAGVDLNVFHDHVSQARSARTRENVAEAAEHLRSALSLWRGAALSGARAWFVGGERARLEQLRLAALEDRITADLALGRHHDVVTEVAAAAAAQPFREHLQELLMLALYRGGRQTEALAVYQEVRAMLRDNLGIDPGPALRQLHQQILRSDPALEPVTQAWPVMTAAVSIRRPATGQSWSVGRSRR